MTTSARPNFRDHFLDSELSDHPQLWEALWQRKQTGWDNGAPNPALIDLLDSGKYLPPRQLAPPAESENRGVQSRPRQEISRPRALVPGCGKGYDVLLFASYGYDAWGIDSAGTAIKAAREDMPGLADKDDYVTRDEKVGRGRAEYLEADFFMDEWLEAADPAKKGFDVIYDYTFFSALPPALRPQWAARLVQLLAPSGRLICLEFPTNKAASTGGPPWAGHPLMYVAHLSKPGEDVLYDVEQGVPDVNEQSPERNSQGLVRIAHWVPERTHGALKGMDMMSLWRHS